MSFFEWLGESYDPGPSGEAQFGARPRGRQTRRGVLVRGFVSLGLLGLLGFIMYHQMGIREFQTYRNAGLGMLVYSLIAYFVHPEPDTSNVGWLGGLVDHPFRYSDDVNRILVFLLLFLLPGRFVSEALVDLIRLIRHSGWKSRPPGS